MAGLRSRDSWHNTTTRLGRRNELQLHLDSLGQFSLILMESRGNHWESRRVSFFYPTFVRIVHVSTRSGLPRRQKGQGTDVSNRPSSPPTTRLAATDGILLLESSFGIDTGSAFANALEIN